MAQVNAIYLQDPVPYTETTARCQSTGNDLQRITNVTTGEENSICPWRDTDCVPRLSSNIL